MKSLSIAKASSNFKHWVDRVCRTGESYEVVDEGIPCARLVPVPHASNAHEVADDLEAAALDRKEEAAYRATIRTARDVLKPLKNPWG